MEFGFSLGANLGDRLGHLKAARDALLAQPDTQPAAQSPVYDTEPVGVKPVHAKLTYLNAVLVVESLMSSRDWLVAIRAIEAGMGRVRGSDRFAPRPIDIDILYAGDECIEGAGLTVPHPRWAKRRFVVQPLADVRPGLCLPGTGLSVSEVLDQLPAGEAVRLFAQTW